MKWWLGFTLCLSVTPAAAQTCTMTVSGISFGSYDPFHKADNKSNGSVKVICNSYSGTYQIAVNAGLYSTGDFARQLSQGTGLYLSYQIYADSARTTVWGDGTSGTVTASYTCSGGKCKNTQKAYGDIPKEQLATPGSYEDTIIVTLTY